MKYPAMMLQSNINSLISDLENRNYSDTDFHLSKLSGYSKYELPDLSDILNSHKIGIIKNFIRTIENPHARDFTKRDMEDTVKALYRLGVTWSELITLSDEIADFTDADDPDELYEQKDYSAVIYSDTIIQLLKKRIANKWFNVTTIEPALDQYKNKILEYIQNSVREFWHRDRRSIYDILRTMNAIRFYGRDWPEFTTIINSNSTLLMKFLLEMIEAGISKDEVELQVHQIRRLGGDWPELDEIESIINDSFYVTDVSESYVDDKISELITDLENDYYDELPNMLCKIYRQSYPGVPDITSLLNKHKVPILKIIIRAIETPAEFYIKDNDMLEDMLNCLRLLGVDWPEFKDIENYVYSQILSEAEWLENIYYD